MGLEPKTMLLERMVVACSAPPASIRWLSASNRDRGGRSSLARQRTHLTVSKAIRTRQEKNSFFSHFFQVSVTLIFCITRFLDVKANQKGEVECMSDTENDARITVCAMPARDFFPSCGYRAKGIDGFVVTSAATAAEPAARWASWRARLPADWKARSLLYSTASHSPKPGRRTTWPAGQTLSVNA